MSTTTPGFNAAVMSWVDDMALIPKKVSGARRVGERIARRCKTPRGHALGHPNDGIDLSDLVESVMGPADAAKLRSIVHAEVLKDPAVKTAYVTITLSAQGQAVSVAVRAFGDFGIVNVNFTKGADGTLVTTIV